MYVSFDTGQTWQVLGEGLPVLPIGDIKIHPIENFLVAGTYGRSMYKIDLDLITDVNENPLQALRDFKLFQNYPNPFNPSTKISWQSPISGWQTIKLYDISGKEIDTIVDGYFEAGSHSKTYVVNLKLSSGIYFYKLTVSNFSETKKMIIIK
jgi:hypothetical protein